MTRPSISTADRRALARLTARIKSSGDQIETAGTERAELVARLRDAGVTWKSLELAAGCHRRVLELGMQRAEKRNGRVA